MSDHQEQSLTPREMVRAHLPIVLDLIKTASLVVIAVSGMLISHHTHELFLEIKNGQSDHNDERSDAPKQVRLS